MNRDRFERTLAAIEALPAPKIRIDKGRTGARSNDPDREYIPNDTVLRANEVDTVIRATLTQINVLIGLATTDTETIGGIAAMVIQTSPDEARRIERESRSTEGTGKSLNEIAAILLDVGHHGWAEHQMLSGPNWAGENAAWLTPGEITAGMRNLQGLGGSPKGTKPANPWQHVQRERLQTLTQVFQPGRAARRAWAVRDDRGLGEDAVLKQIEQEYPRSEIAADAKIPPSATIGCGCRIGRGVTIGEHVWIHERCRINDNASIGDRARIAPNTDIDKKARVGHGARIGAGSRISESAKIGDNARIGEANRIGSSTDVDDGVTTGERCVISNDAKVTDAALSDEVVIEHNASVGPAVEIGSGVVIGHSARVSNAKVPRRSIIAGTLTVRTQGEADRYAVLYEGDERPQAPGNGMTTQGPEGPEQAAASRRGARPEEGTPPQGP